MHFITLHVSWYGSKNSFSHEKHSSLYQCFIKFIKTKSLQSNTASAAIQHNTFFHRHNDASKRRPCELHALLHTDTGTPRNPITRAFISPEPSFIAPECRPIFQDVFLSVRFLGIPRIPNEPMDARQFRRVLRFQRFPITPTDFSESQWLPRKPMDS